MSGKGNDAQGNIFLTTENLAFSMPLILVCTTYAYFKFVPLEYGVPALAGIFVLFQIKAQFKTLREKKIENMDETDINDLANELMDEDDEDAKKKEAEDLKIQKKKARLAERLAAEQRKAEKAAKRSQGKKKTTADDDDDVDGMATFARKKKN